MSAIYQTNLQLSFFTRVIWKHRGEENPRGA
jgi:hypothetical protein